MEVLLGLTAVTVGMWRPHDFFFFLDDTAGNYSAVREIGRSREREEG